MSFRLRLAYLQLISFSSDQTALFTFLILEVLYDVSDSSGSEHSSPKHLLFIIQKKRLPKERSAYRAYSRVHELGGYTKTKIILNCESC